MMPLSLAETGEEKVIRKIVSKLLAIFFIGHNHEYPARVFLQGFVATQCFASVNNDSKDSMTISFSVVSWRAATIQIKGSRDKDL